MTRMASPNMHNTMSSTLCYFRVRIPNTHCITCLCVQLSSCFFYFLHFHYKHFYGLHLMNRGQSIRPLSERAKEEVAWDKDWKASLLQTLYTIIHTYIVNVLCACTVKFHTFPFGQLTASLMLQFHSYYSPLSFCLMEFSAFSFLLDGMSVIRPFTIQYTLVLFCSTFKKMRLYLIFFSPSIPICTWKNTLDQSINKIHFRNFVAWSNHFHLNSIHFTLSLARSLHEI